MKQKYDIIFLDHMMPDMDGIETLNNLKKLENNMSKDAPVIALTANTINTKIFFIIFLFSRLIISSLSSSLSPLVYSRSAASLPNIFPYFAHFSI